MDRVGVKRFTEEPARGVESRQGQVWQVCRTRIDLFQIAGAWPGLSCKARRWTGNPARLDVSPKGFPE
jgi:hypothetical protein